MRAVPFEVFETVVLLRAADPDETRQIEHAVKGGDFEPHPPRSYRLSVPERPLLDGELYVVARTFVDFDDGRGRQRWGGAEHHGLRVSLADDATIDLLALAREAEDEGLIELLADMGIAGLAVTRWALMSAPRRYELAPELFARLAPLRRR